jgi:GTP-binding protein
VEIRSVTFQCAALKPAQRPRDWLPQVAVAGRSNVGKSSLINWLFNRSLARVAKAPGKTRTLNFYLVNRSFFLVDLPGYGYAKVQRSLRQEWSRELGSYLAREKRLAGVVTLVDIRHGPTALDLELQELLLECGRERLVVLTKADKEKRGRRHAMQNKVQHQLGLPTPPMIVSVRTGEGRKELLQQVHGLIIGWNERERTLGD